MNARTEAEVDMLNNEYQMRIPESAIIHFIDDYDSEAAEMLVELMRKHDGDAVSIIGKCIKFAYLNTMEK